MAIRPVFVPDLSADKPRVETREVEFQWFPGLSKSQKQKSVESLHESALVSGLSNLLEISSKSKDALGNQLSAFELKITTRKQKIFSVECAFQGSKVFEYGGPFVDLLDKTSREAKMDIRLKESGNLCEFEFYGQRFPLKPRTYFYDWLYISALHQNSSLAEMVCSYRAFTDIEFNPKKSINCQAYSVALYVSLYHAKFLDDAMDSKEAFLELLQDEYKLKDDDIAVQGTLL